MKPCGCYDGCTQGRGSAAAHAPGGDRRAVSRTIVRSVPPRPTSAEGQAPDDRLAGCRRIGNVLRHAYDEVSERRVLQTVTEDLPALKVAIEAMLANVGRETGS